MTDHLGPATVLVVEDDALTRVAAVHIIETNGYRALSASNAEDAMATLCTHEEVDVLFTDVSMPGQMDGLELAKEASVIYPRVGIVVTSALARSLDEIPKGATFLPKPYTRADIAGALQAMIDPKRPLAV